MRLLLSSNYCTSMRPVTLSPIGGLMLTLTIPLYLSASASASFARSDDVRRPRQRLEARKHTGYLDCEGAIAHLPDDDPGARLPVTFSNKVITPSRTPPYDRYCLPKQEPAAECVVVVQFPEGVPDEDKSSWKEIKQQLKSMDLSHTTEGVAGMNNRIELELLDVASYQQGLGGGITTTAFNATQPTDSAIADENGGGGYAVS